MSRHDVVHNAARQQCATVSRLQQCLGTTVAVGLIAALTAVPSTIPAPAYAAEQTAKTTSIGEITAALRNSPVYVSDAFRTEIPSADQHSLVQHIKRTGLPLKVVLVPFSEDTSKDTSDAWNGSSEQLAGVLHNELSSSANEEFLLLTNEDLGDDRLDGYEWPDDQRYNAPYAAMAVGEQPDMQGASLKSRLQRAVDLTAAGTGEKAYEKAQAQQRQSDDAPRRATDRDDQDSGLSTAAVVGLGAGTLLILALLGGLLAWRRRRSALSPTTMPRAVFTAAQQENERALRNRMHREVLNLGEELAALDVPEPNGPSPEAHLPHRDTRDDAATPPLRRALDAYNAAGTVLDHARGVPDLAGVLALVTEGRDAIAAALHETAAGKDGSTAHRRNGRPSKRSRTDRLPLCFFHPLHGRATHRVTWRLLGQRQSLKVSACAECRHAVHTHRPPETLTDRQGDQDIPYFEVPAEQSLWAATGYGSLTADPLAPRVQRGDFTRAAARRKKRGQQPH